MKILVISAYPNRVGFNYAIKRKVLNNINNEKNEVTEIDLYEQGFDPVLRFDENNRRRDLVNEPYTASYRNLVKSADFFIFIYPIWWGGMPAIMKGFIDRVFVKGFAYKYNGISPVGLLGGKKAWIITTNDTPFLYAKIFYQDYGKVLKNQVLKMCGIKTIKHSQLYFVRHSTEKKRLDFLSTLSLFAKKI
ncbi:NAD(P)H-dependent oxidoreductase [Leuconostoc citreum]